MEKEAKNPVVEVAHSVQADVDEVVKLSTGYKARIVPVSASLIDKVTSKIKDPEVPMWLDENKGREEPNPSDPKYLIALDEAQSERGRVAMDALIMFGVELEEPLPEDNKWVKKLKFLDPDLVVDIEDELEREFSFKKYIAVGADDVALVTERSGMSAEDVAEAERTFRRKAE